VHLIFQISVYLCFTSFKMFFYISKSGQCHIRGDQLPKFYSFSCPISSRTIHLPDRIHSIFEFYCIFKQQYFATYNFHKKPKIQQQQIWKAGLGWGKSFLFCIVYQILLKISLINSKGDIVSVIYSNFVSFRATDKLHTKKLTREYHSSSWSF
jgi:hypothetical protein